VLKPNTGWTWYSNQASISRLLVALRVPEAIAPAVFLTLASGDPSNSDALQIRTDARVMEQAAK